jgi:methylthioribose-1-phosphate isomerase
VWDQRKLPHQMEIIELKHYPDAVAAIRDMTVRGAPLIGVTAAYGMWLAAAEAVAHSPATLGEQLQQAAQALKAARPTAVNLAWAVDRCLQAWAESQADAEDSVRLLRTLADTIRQEDIDQCRAIGEHGLALIRTIAEQKPAGEPVRILTHCNAGWLGCIDYGTATAPIYLAHDAGIALQVWVDETRPRNQGSNLTAWELQQHGIPVQLIVDNAGGHLMQQGLVDLCIVGTDRTTRTGDVANKIGTYLKALAAKDNAVPFYVALPGSTIDFGLQDGIAEIPIEDRGPDEVRYIQGWDEAQQALSRVRICPPDTPATNPGFDVTPARLVTALITERGVCPASEAGLLTLFADKARELEQRAQR